MELPLITDAAARQVIDSTKAFKEYVRVRNELKELGSSIRWKNVNGYEYLVQREGHRLAYLGKRSPETEQKHDEHAKKRKRLETRFKSLSGIVETSQRMNKAVRAGAVPAELIEVLLKLDELDLADRSILLGAPALYAYGQSSGLRIDAIKTPSKREGLVAEAAKCVHVLIEDSDSVASTSFRRLTESMKRVASVEHAAVKCGSGTALDIVFHLSKKAASDKVSTKTSQKPTLKAARPAEPWLDIIRAAPKYEQVVISKTGKMAFMRTVDPLLFSVSFQCANAFNRVSTRTPELAASQIELVELVETMLKEHMVNSKIDPAQRALLEKRILPESLSSPILTCALPGG